MIQVDKINENIYTRWSLNIISSIRFFSMDSQFAAVFAAICEVRLDQRDFDPNI